MTREPWDPTNPEPITRAELAVALAGGVLACFIAWLVLALAIALFT